MTNKSAKAPTRDAITIMDLFGMPLRPAGAALADGEEVLPAGFVGVDEDDAPDEVDRDDVLDEEEGEEVADLDPVEEVAVGIELDVLDVTL